MEYILYNPLETHATYNLIITYTTVKAMNVNTSNNLILIITLKNF